MRIHPFRSVARCVPLLAATLCAPLAAQGEGEEGPRLGPTVRFGIEAKAHLRRSDENRFPVPFPFPPEQLPPGQDRAFLQTVDPGTSLELSAVTLFVDATWSELLAAHLKVDMIDLYDRNPTSGDKKVDVDEAWLRFGREMPPATLPAGSGAYLKVGKFGHFERQDDRHLESYGLVSTAFNRFEDTGVELGVDLGRHLYLKGSVTQGNPVFIRDPNALAGDNGTLEQLRNPHPRHALGSGILILYDAEVEDVDVDGDPELGIGVGLRFGDETGERGLELLAWGYERTLADTVDLEGTVYGGDLDLLLGPGNLTPLPLAGDEKREVGGNLWLYYGGVTLFAQYVDQELAGLPRTGWEVEAAWSIELPVRWALAGQQLFPFVAPAARYSRLDPDFANHPLTPVPSVSWEWDKLDAGVRLGIVPGTDLTLEYARNRFILKSGREAENDEYLATLRWRW
ncbi:MAG TPA: hypothetical protein VMT16_13970 [Thermoanaerobaculia bacterium]|nr:hypothetical protein [Thermoanaerobaculia bacterium]